MILEHNGGIVLMHDVKPITAKIIGEVLDDLEAENCKRLATRAAIRSCRCRSTTSCATARPRARSPTDVQKRTEAYKLALPVRCVNRRARAEAEIFEAQQKLRELQERRTKQRDAGERRL